LVTGTRDADEPCHLAVDGGDKVGVARIQGIRELPLVVDRVLAELARICLVTSLIDPWTISNRGNGDAQSSIPALGR
jgi:hypothetical protein